MEKINILIVGTGAVGSFYGGKLSQSGANVSVLSRSDYKEVKKNGIYIESYQGNFHFTPEEVINNITDYSKDADFLIVSTKVLPDLDIVELIKSQVKKNTSIVLIQNGINIEYPIHKAFPNNEIISAIALSVFQKQIQVKFLHQDYGRINIGSYPKGISKKVTLLKNLFTESGVKCLDDENIISSRWKKLVWNAPFNPLSVIAGCVTTDLILKNEKTTNLAKKIMEEVVTLANMSGYKLPDDIISTNINNTLKMTPYKTSMLLDYENKRPLEVEANFRKCIKKQQKKKKIATPNIEIIYELLSFLNDNNLN